jgi:signal transduction histidine kinase/CheY-like chemotaxis protein
MRVSGASVPVLNAVIISLSVLLQLTAAVLAIRLVRVTDRLLTWALISLALVGMSLRRLYMLVQVFEQSFPEPLLLNEVLGLVISLLMVAGLILIRQTFLVQVQRKAKAEQAEAEALKQAGRLRTLMEATPIPIWIAEDASCQRMFGNPAASRLLRMPIEANVSKSAPEGEAPTHFTLQRDGVEVPPEDLPMQKAARGEEVRDEALDLVFEDGEVRQIIASAAPVRNAWGGVEGAVCAFMDYTEFSRAEEALSQAQKLESLGMMAGGIAHDFNNIFQGMMGNLELARTHLPPGNISLTHLGKVEGALERAARLSRDLLHFSGGELRRPEPQNLTVLAEALLDHLKSNVERHLAPDLPLVMMDPKLLKRAAEGLLSNAIEASRPGVPPKVRTYTRRVTREDLATGYWPEAVEPGNCVVLEVSDQGHGIPSQAMAKIFDPFFSTRNLGRGLGLPAALGIVRGHRGGIQVESIEGVGSAFRIFLPCQEETPEAGLKAPLASASRGALLLADDEQELREALGEMLREWFHFEVVEAEDGQEALEIFQRQPDAFSVVILDATMPRMGGILAFDAMRKIRPDIRGILCSGYALEGAREQALAHGFSDFLNKPFSSSDLEEVLERTGKP